MQVVVKLFATFKDRVGKPEITLQLPDGATAAMLRDQVLADYPALSALMETGILAVNRQFAAPDTVLRAGDQIALFPPVSGGSSQRENVCRITSNALDLNEIIHSLTTPATGAVVTFTGTVRAQDQRDDRQVSQLHYEAYTSMAEAKLRQVADEMRERFADIQSIALIQRIGTLAAGEPTIVVAVSSAHRDRGCFEAARYGIDRIKEIVPVWKREIGPGGEVWIEGHYQPKAGD